MSPAAEPLHAVCDRKGASCFSTYGLGVCKDDLDAGELDRAEIIHSLFKRLVYFEPIQHLADGDVQDLPMYHLQVLLPGGDAHFSKLVLLIACLKSPVIPIFASCECDHCDVAGYEVGIKHILYPTDVFMDLVRTPGQLSINLVRYLWLPNGIPRVEAYEDITAQLWEMFSKTAKRKIEARGFGHIMKNVMDPPVKPSKAKTCRQSETKRVQQGKTIKTVVTSNSCQ